MLLLHQAYNGDIVDKDVIQYCIVFEKPILEEDEIEKSKNRLQELVKIVKKRKVRNVKWSSLLSKSAIIITNIKEED